jgi:hypothetical protein
MSLRRAVALAALATLALLAAPTPSARADSPAPISEAGRHFQRGVQLYNEADYHAALVEFRRAYELAPNPTVLYNIGQTYYQLQNYAGALVAFGRYLTEAGPTAPHRREVEATIDTLQTRVGKIAVSGSLPGLDITIDDELIGRTPLDEPIVVSIGRRKITALRDGRPVENRYVDVTAGDTVKLTLSASTETKPQTLPGGSTPQSSGRSATTIGWWVTGSLGAVALVAGGAAFFESRSLKSAREMVPATRTDLDSKATLVSRLSLAADISGALALIAGGITLRMTLSQSESHEAHVSIAPAGIEIAGKF